MKKTMSLVFVCLLASGFSFAKSVENLSLPKGVADAMPWVKMKQEVLAINLAELPSDDLTGRYLIKMKGVDSVQVIEFCIPCTVTHALDILGRDNLVEYMEPEIIYHLTDASTNRVMPNDPYVRRQTPFFDSLGRTSELFARFKSEELTVPKVHVWILDSGLYCDDPDLDMAHITLEHNVPRYEMPPCVSMKEAPYHGTAMLGMLASKVDNGLGIAGIAPPGTQFHVLRVADKNGNVNSTDVAYAIGELIDRSEGRGRDIVNMSFSSLLPSVIMHEMITVATKRNITFFASSGNSGINWIEYPARFPEVIAVGASTMTSKGDFQRAWYSSYDGDDGRNLVLVPVGDMNPIDGTDLTSAMVAECWDRAMEEPALMMCYQTGTSHASVIAAGIAANIVVWKGVTGPDQIRWYMFNYARKNLGVVGYDGEMGHGVLGINFILDNP